MFLLALMNKCIYVTLAEVQKMGDKERKHGHRRGDVTKAVVKLMGSDLVGIVGAVASTCTSGAVAASKRAAGN